MILSRSELALFALLGSFKGIEYRGSNVLNLMISIFFRGKCPNLEDLFIPKRNGWRSWMLSKSWWMGFVCDELGRITHYPATGCFCCSEIGHETTVVVPNFLGRDVVKRAASRAGKFTISRGTWALRCGASWHAKQSWVGAECHDFLVAW